MKEIVLVFLIVTNLELAFEASDPQDHFYINGTSTNPDFLKVTKDILNFTRRTGLEDLVSDHCKVLSQIKTFYLK